MYEEGVDIPGTGKGRDAGGDPPAPPDPATYLKDVETSNVTYLDFPERGGEGATLPESPPEKPEAIEELIEAATSAAIWFDVMHIKGDEEAGELSTRLWDVIEEVEWIYRDEL